MTRATWMVLVGMAACAADPALDGSDGIDDTTTPDDQEISDPQTPTRTRAVEGVAPVLPPGSLGGDAPDTAAPIDAPVDPSCAILSPADGEEVAVGVPVWFEGEVADGDGGVVTVTWRSDKWGAMVVGTAFEFELPAADHVITMTAVDDDDRSCTASVHLVVR